MTYKYKTAGCRLICFISHKLHCMVTEVCIVIVELSLVGASITLKYLSRAIVLSPLEIEQMPYVALLKGVTKCVKIFGIVNGLVALRS